MIAIVMILLTTLLVVGAIRSVFYFGKNRPQTELSKQKFFVTPQENTVFASVRGGEDPIFGIASSTQYLAEGGDPMPAKDGTTLPGFIAREKVRKWCVIDTTILREIDIPQKQWPKPAIRQLDVSFWGRYWTGLWPFRQLYFEKLNWGEWKGTGNKPQYTAREENTFFLFTRTFAYAMILNGAETSKGVPVDVQFTLYVKTTNPHTAWFLREDWKGQLDEVVLAAAKRFVGKRDFRGLGTEIDGVKDEEKRLFTEEIWQLNRSIPQEFGKSAKQGEGVCDRFGMFIESAQMTAVTLSPSEELDEAGKATRAEYIAEQAAKAEIQKALGEKRALIERAEGEAKAIRTKADAGTYQAEVEYKAIVKAGGKELRVGENIRDSKLRTLAIGTNAVLALSEENKDEETESKS